jgi:hypothetical protein
MTVEQKIAARLSVAKFEATPEAIQAITTRINNIYGKNFVDPAIDECIQFLNTTGQLTPVPEKPAQPAPPNHEQMAALIVQVFTENPQLADTPENGRVLVLLVQKYKAAWTLEALRAILGAHKNDFQWLVPAQPQAAVQFGDLEEPAEQLESWQLPINASEEEMRAASKEAMRDLVKRQNAGHRIGFL